MDKFRLEYIMRKHGDNAGDLAAYLGINRTTFSMKINERRSGFTQSEIMAIKKKYDLSSEEVGEIFFAENVSKLDTKEVS